MELCADAELRRWHKNTNNKDLQESFLRFNLDLFGYGYLKQFKEKEAFRLVVGDRRNSLNRHFGNKLGEKLNVPNAIDFMFS